MLALLGGVIGIMLGLGLAGIAGLLWPYPSRQVPRSSRSLSLFSGAIGLVFGFFPARRAARLDPIDALRHE